METHKFAKNNCFSKSEHSSLKKQVKHIVSKWSFLNFSMKKVNWVHAREFRIKIQNNFLKTMVRNILFAGENQNCRHLWKKIDVVNVFTCEQYINFLFILPWRKQQ